MTTRDIFHAIAQVLIERRERLAEFRQIVGQLAELAAAHFVHVRVPAADIGERHFQSDIGFDQSRDLLQALAESAARILRAIRRHVALLLDGLHDLHGAERLLAGAVQHRVERMVVHALERGRADADRALENRSGCSRRRRRCARAACAPGWSPG